MTLVSFPGLVQCNLTPTGSGEQPGNEATSLSLIPRLQLEVENSLGMRLLT